MLAPTQAIAFIRRSAMQEEIMDLSGELDFEFEAYVSAGQEAVGGEAACTIIQCGTLQCTVLGCC